MDIERVGSQRVGSQAARRHPGWPTPRHGPAARIGRRLLREAHRWCLQAGAERLQPKAAQDNAVALTLFCSEGYRMVGRLPHYYGVGRHALRMERSAQPEGSAVDSLKPGPASAMISDIR